MNKKIKYPSYESFPETIKYIGSIYYKVKGTYGFSANSEDVAAHRYTDSPSGMYKDNIPLYMDAYGKVLWDGPSNTIPCIVDIADINKAIPILVPSVWIVFDEVTKGMFVFYTERAAECYKNKHWRTTGHSTTMKEYKINVSK